jgi:uncharacterized membrane protein
MDLLLVTILSVVLVLLALLASGPLRIALGLLFVLFFPGYVLLAALFPRKGALGGLERVSLSFGLSLAVVPMMGLVLNFTPLGIRLGSTLFSVIGFILVAAVAAFYRRKGLSPEDRFEVRFMTLLSPLVSGWQRQRVWDKVLTGALVMSIVMSIGTLVYALSVEKTGERFTQFYVLGPEGEAENYPREMSVGESSTVILGIVNNEQSPLTYRVEMAIGGEGTREIGRVTLQNEEKREWEVSFASDRTGPKQRVDFFLYKGEDREVYHSLQLIVDVKESK